MSLPSINWRWIGYRIAMTPRCRHGWIDGDSKGRQACEKCGVWRWFPIWTRNRGANPDSQEQP